jgi:protein SCO1/2
MARPRAPVLPAALAVLALALVAGALAAALRPRLAAPLPVLGSVPAFDLVDQDGRRFRDADLRAHVWAAGFVFTRCPTICPVITGRMRAIQDATRDLGPAFRLVSFSVDPEYDSPAVLAAYARANGAAPGRWTFLTGAYDALEAAVVDGFHVLMERDPSDAANVLHGSHVVLVDGAGRIRGYYDAADADCAERVVRDARALVARPDRDEGRVAGR